MESEGGDAASSSKENSEPEEPSQKQSQSLCDYRLPYIKQQIAQFSKEKREELS